METNQDQTEIQVAETTPNSEPESMIAPPPSPPTVNEESKVTIAATGAKKVRTEKNKPAKKSSKTSKPKNTESSDSDTRDAESESENSVDHEKGKRKKKRKAAVKTQETRRSKIKAKLKKRKSKRRIKKADLSDDSSDDTCGTSIESGLDTTSDSETDGNRTRRSSHKTHKAKSKSKRKSKRNETSSDDDESELSSNTSSSSDSDSTSDDVKAERKRAKTKRRVKKLVEFVASASESEDAPLSPGVILEFPVPGDDINTQVAKMDAILRSLKTEQLAATNAATVGITPRLPKSLAKKNAHEFKRIDQVWDTKLRDYKLIESTADQKDEFECVFTVRRRFNWEGKHHETLVDIKSKALRSALQVILKECKNVSLVEDTPEVDPHTLFHHYNEIKQYVKHTMKPKLKRTRKSKDRKKLTQEIAQCKLLLGYIDEDFAATRKALKPLLKAGTITYDLCWALFKPDTIVYTPTYGNKDDPRCFKVDQCFEYESWLSGAKSWMINGRYLEYDGKVFGFGDHQTEIKAFKGHKKITSLVAYPLEYHKDLKNIQKQLIERGKKFVALQGMSYRLQKGIAYMKVKNTIAKFNINGRVMIDPAIFRRIQPNYPLSYIKQDELDREDEEQEVSDDCCYSNEEDDGDLSGSERPEKDPLRVVLWKDSKGKKHPITVFQSQVDAENGVGENATSKLEMDEDGHMARHIFTEEELLIASPVVLGFAFSEKLWLEFSLSGIEEIQWNAEAFESLVLPDRVKSNLKGLVSSHRFNAARTIDDVIQGKGKGLNVVLHGPPGVGKTLTGESIAEYLKCPLYAVSAGELGTNSGSLERDLNRIMDITHSWGAILLLDEADVFLEARQPHDIHRNSLVSVFLRLTEYYQGILFLTTNRVETFDEAFQSRIHMGIRYENLKPPARKKIWQHHVGKVEKMAMEELQEGKGKDRSEKKPFKELDFDELSKKNMNGRQIKNTVKTGQSIALSEGAAFGMEHIKRVLEVAEAFEDDMRGGKGYRDAMLHYT
ncbi:uncharacterized protein EKO05_0000712 [Ascochyta rabiei]|uniref:ATP binding n=1 Tax=Didymella rabiei TaxID=5454 RepID=A0A163B3J1_DIDRA|nr:uncharacterized protein EKO05_0000712 [Ascochyta rabiei]KZM21553.1 ATP binding [Ascochyta rabiei]UPX10036.1 hypothetical protein EKO05_0000712 [Ascochyta rabiei]